MTKKTPNQADCGKASRANPGQADQAPPRDWHRAFGIALVDVFVGAPWRVELEQELSLTSQELDVAIIEAAEPGCQARLPDPLPDGLENLNVLC